MIRWLMAVFSLPLLAVAAPVKLSVTKGPIITAVTRHDAWVAWETSVEEGAGGPCPKEKGPVATLRLTRGKSRPLTFRDRACSRAHHIHVTDLRANTGYTITLDQAFETGAKAEGHFTTAPSQKDGTFSFVVYGDNREPPEGQAQTRNDHEAIASAILKHEPNAAFLVHTGDLALNLPKVSGPDRGYAEFFDVERALLVTRPIFAVVGNHEALDMDEYDSLVNAGSYAHSAHPYYGSVDWGRVHLALLDSFEGPARAAAHGGGRDPGVSAEQLHWLDQDLAVARQAGQVIFVVTHQGPYSHFAKGAKGHGGSLEQQEKLVPLLRKHGASAVFAGHDHYYQRGHEGCLNYFVVGSGGAPMYEPDNHAPGVLAGAKVISYLVVTVHGAEVHAVARNTAGESFDASVLEPASSEACAAASEGTPPAKGEQAASAPSAP
jgi:hypothetical protein